MAMTPRTSGLPFAALQTQCCYLHAAGAPGQQAAQPPLCTCACVFAVPLRPVSFSVHHALLGLLVSGLTVTLASH